MDNDSKYKLVGLLEIFKSNLRKYFNKDEAAEIKEWIIIIQQAVELSIRKENKHE